MDAVYYAYDKPVKPNPKPFIDIEIDFSKIYPNIVLTDTQMKMLKVMLDKEMSKQMIIACGRRSGRNSLFGFYKRMQEEKLNKKKPFIFR